MQYKIYSDIHYFAPHELPDIRPDYRPKSVFTGDIYDLVNTQKKDIEKALKAQSSHNKLCDENGLINIAGNHDLLPKDFRLYYVIGDILFLHGHTICWDQSQVDEWASKKPKGLSKLKWMYLIAKHALPEGLWKPDDIIWGRALKLAEEYKCSRLVFGHTHTKEVVKYTRNDVTLINVPRGITTLDL